MIKEEYLKPSHECIGKMCSSVKVKDKYTMRDVEHLIIESLFHKWECGTLAGQTCLAAYVIALVAGLKKARLSKEVQNKCVEYCKAVGYASENIFC